MKLATIWLLIAGLFPAAALADDPSTFDQRFGVVATDSSGYGGSIVPYQGPQFFEPLRTAWWYNYTPQITSQHVPGLTLFWPGYQRLYMFWRAVSTTSATAIQQYAAAAKAADPTHTIWWAMSNEPNDSQQANQSPADFAAIYLKHHQNLRIGDPTCKIMGPGLLNWTWTNINDPLSGKAWYEAFRSAWAANPDCIAYSQSVNGTNYPPQDAFSIHSYDLAALPDDWQYCRDQLIACHNDLQSYPETQGLPVWNTEWGSLRAPTVAQAADMMSGLGLWMKDQPWMQKWFLFYTHDDKYSAFSVLNLFDDSGAPTQLAKAYRDLSLLTAGASYWHFTYSATWDQSTPYTRSGSSQSTSVAEAFNAPGYSLSLTNGLTYAANSMRGRTFTSPNGYVYRVRFNYITNYDNAYCTLAMDVPGLTNKWQVDSFGVSTDYVDIDLSADPVASVSFGLFIKSGFTYPNPTGDWRGVISNLMLLTCPNPPVVTDGGAYTTDPHRITASWTTPAGGRQPVAQYRYAVGTAPKAADVVDWIETASTSIDRTGLDLQDGVIYYVSVRARDSDGNWGAIGCSDGIRKLAASAHPLKQLSANASSGLRDQVVSAVFTDCVYVQNADRTSGIKVKGLAGATPGAAVTIIGAAASENQEALLKDAVLVSSTPGTEPDPRAMNNLEVAGGVCGLQPAAVNDASRADAGKLAGGINTTGLLVKTFGRVTYIDPGTAYCYIDDGSHIRDGSGHTGIRVKLDYGPVPNPDAYALVTGCCSAFDQGGLCARLLRPRRSSDLRFSAAANYLLNPGFEAGTLSPWTLTGTGAGVQANGWRVINAHTGTKFVGVYGPRVLYNGAVCQTVEVPAGDYSASVWSSIQHPATSDPEITKNRIGIDPTGGSDPNSPDIIWSDWQTTTGATLTPWTQMATPNVTVAGGPVTVFLQYWEQDATKNHINCFDDAVLAEQ